jgi:hypothetical protein
LIKHFLFFKLLLSCNVHRLSASPLVRARIGAGFGYSKLPFLPLIKFSKYKNRVSRKEQEDSWYYEFGDILPMVITPNTSLQFKIDTLWMFVDY